jgi:hypothetical protein
MAFVLQKEIGAGGFQVELGTGDMREREETY